MIEMEGGPRFHAPMPRTPDRVWSGHCGGQKNDEYGARAFL